MVGGVQRGGQGGLTLQVAMGFTPAPKSLGQSCPCVPQSGPRGEPEDLGPPQFSPFAEGETEVQPGGVAGWTQVESGWDWIGTGGFCLILRPPFFLGHTSQANG